MTASCIVPEILVNDLHVPPDQVWLGSRLREDFGFDFLDFAEMALALEERGFELSSKEAGELHTVGDLYRFLRVRLS